MKKIFLITIGCILGVALSACGAMAPSALANSSSGSSSNTGSSGSSNAAPISETPAPGLSALQIAAGMLKLDGTSNAVTAQEATKLLPLWQSLQSIESNGIPQGGTQGTPGPRPNTAMVQQAAAQIQSIEAAMDPAQIQAITAMNLSRQDIFAAFQQAGITMGGFGQGGGFRQNGGTFTPPQGNPPVARTPRAFTGNGGRQDFGSFLPPSVLDGIVKYLQTKAGV
jgi:hypothetical protein